MRIPKLCFHKSKRLGYVNDPVTRRERYFASAWGPGNRDHPSPAVVDEYKRWLARLLLRREEVPGDLNADGLTMAELLRSFLSWAKVYYRRPNGKLTSEPANIAWALEQVMRLYPAMPVDEFGPLALKAVRAGMVERGHSRKFINDSVHRIRRAIRWGVENELIEPDVLAKLKAVPALAKGRTKAPDNPKIKPVDFATIEATIAEMSPLWAALVRVHLHSGMRAEEAVCLRMVDVDRASVPWLYRPPLHKTSHRDVEREIWLGPQARAALEPLLVHLPRNAWVFPGRGRGPHAKFDGHATVSGYRHRIRAACRRANVAAWCPRQLRHTWLTFLRHNHAKGIEAAQVIGGHQELSTTQIYAEQNRELGRDAAEQFG